MEPYPHKNVTQPLEYILQYWICICLTLYSNLNLIPMKIGYRFRIALLARMTRMTNAYWINAFHWRAKKKKDCGGNVVINNNRKESGTTASLLSLPFIFTDGWSLKRSNDKVEKISEGRQITLLIRSSSSRFDWHRSAVNRKIKAKSIE